MTMTAAERERVDVVIVGAGLSGLTAAMRFQQAGKKVVVVEAADQVGGRTRSQLVGGQVLDLGGQLVGTHYTQLHQLIAGLGLHLQPQLQLPRVALHPNARPELRPSQFHAIARAARDLRRWSSLIPPHEPWRAPQATELDHLSLCEWLDSTSLPDQTASLLASATSSFTLAAAERLSLLHFLVWVAPAGGLNALWRETRWRVREGAQEISRRLAARLRTPPVLNNPVSAIEDTGIGVTVHGADGRCWHAAHAAVCVPLPTTDAIEFQPNLPTEQAALVADVTSPAVTKLVASITRRGSLVHIGDPVLRVADRSGDQALGFAYGDDSDLPANQLRAHLLGTLGLRHRDVDGFVAQRWRHEPHARGGYPAFSPGQLTHHGPALRTSHGRIHFAGGDRSTWPGTMEGAVRDGNRLAEHLLHSGS